MKVLIVGGGGREHALAWKCAQSPRVEQVLVAPGNAGTALEPKTANVEVAAEDTEALVELGLSESIDLAIVGPEAPLASGLVDAYEAAGLRCFGPRRAAARLEASKTFAKNFLGKYAIPTAASASFTDAPDASAYIRSQRVPIVVKADGLAAGKGVTVAETREEAIRAAEDMLCGDAFGAAGKTVVVEEFLRGEEVSFMALVDGEHVLSLASSQDHKARDDGDRGPNTGGMGAYSPAPVVDAPMHRRIMREVITPTVRGMAAEGVPYIGFLYAGLMVSEDKVPRVLEFNCRLGDPETQPILMRLKSDLPALCEAALERRLDRVSPEWDARAALGVVMAAGGYPGAYRKGDVISGLEASVPGTKVFHAGTERRGEEIVTNGGRVLCVCGLGEDITAAQRAAYQRAALIEWQDSFYRRDIGHRAVARARSG